VTELCLIGRLGVWLPGLVCVLIAGCPCAQGQDDDAAEHFTGRERLNSYVERTFTSKSRLVFLFVDTAEDHLQRQPKEWDLGGSGLAARLGSNYGRRLIRNTIELGAGALLSEDSRYRPSTEPGIAPRMRHAVASAFTARVDGHRRPAYATLAALTATAFIVSVWQPRRFSACEVMRGVSFSLLDRVPDRLLDEFSPDMKRFGKRMWRGTVAGGRSLLTQLQQ
jgi:hypothetical protein